MLLRRVLVVAIIPAVHPIPRRVAPQSSVALRLVPRRCHRAALHPPSPGSSSLRAAPLLLRAVPRPPRAPRCCQHHRSPPEGMAVVDALVVVTRDLSKKMLR